MPLPHIASGRQTSLFASLFGTVIEGYRTALPALARRIGRRGSLRDRRLGRHKRRVCLSSIDSSQLRQKRGDPPVSGDPTPYRIGSYGPAGGFSVLRWEEVHLPRDRAAPQHGPNKVIRFLVCLAETTQTSPIVTLLYRKQMEPTVASPGPRSRRRSARFPRLRAGRLHHSNYWKAM